MVTVYIMFFFSSRRRHTRCLSDWSSYVCSSDLDTPMPAVVLSAPVVVVIRPPEQIGTAKVQVPQLPATVKLPEVLDSRMRSEERRVGKECRSGWSAYDL